MCLLMITGHLVFLNLPHLMVSSRHFWNGISDTVKIALALQNVKGNLAQSLNVSIRDSTTWPQVHALLINYFNNAVPVDLKPIHQFDQTEKTEINSFKKGKGKGQKSKGQKGKGSKGSSSFQSSKGKQKGKGKTKSKGKGQWTTWSWGQDQQNANWGQGQKGQKGSKSGKGKSACSVCGKSGHTSNQCWWNRDQEGWNFSRTCTTAQGKLRFTALKGSLQHSSVPSGSTNSDLTSRSAQRFSRSATSSSTTAVSEPKSGFDSMRFNCDCSFEFRSRGWIQWPETQHQLSFWFMRSWFRNHGARNLCVIPISNRFRPPQSPSGTMGSTH